MQRGYLKISKNCWAWDEMCDTWSMMTDIDEEITGYDLLNEPLTVNLTNKQQGMALMEELLGHNVLYLGSVSVDGAEPNKTVTLGRKKGSSSAFGSLGSSKSSSLGRFSSFVGVMTELVLITGELEDVSGGDLALAYILDVILGTCLPADKQGVVEEKDITVLIVIQAEGSLSKNLKLIEGTLENVEQRMIRSLTGVVVTAQGEKGVFKAVKGCKSFTTVEALKASEVVERYGASVIPCELGGEYELTDYDSWITARLKFEIYWENCRLYYSRVELLPSRLSLLSTEALQNLGGRSLIRAQFNKDLEALHSEIVMSSIDNEGEHMIASLSSHTSIDLQTLLKAARELANIVKDIRMKYFELEDLYKVKLAGECDWLKFQSKSSTTMKMLENAKGRVIALQEQLQDSGQGYNDCYVEMQSLRSSISILTSHVAALPPAKQHKAQKIIEELTSDAECVTVALGQTFEYKTNKNIVVNIQLNVMSWISNMTELLDNILSGADVLSPEYYSLDQLVGLQEKIRVELSSCPIEVIDNFTLLCERIGSDYLLAAVTSLERVTANLILAYTDTCTFIHSVIDAECKAFLLQFNAFCVRISACNRGTETDHIDDIEANMNKICSLLQSLPKYITKDEMPDILDTAALEKLYYAGYQTGKDLYGEIKEAMEAIIDIAEQHCQFRRNRSFRSYSMKKIRSTPVPHHVTENLLKETTEPFHNVVNTINIIVSKLETQSVSSVVQGQIEDRLSSERKLSAKLGNLYKEFIETEQVYVKSLGYFYNELLQPLDKRGDRRIEETVQCLYNIWILHCRLHQDLIAQGNNIEALSEVFTTHKDEFEVYAEYILAQPYLEELVKQHEDYFRQKQIKINDLLPVHSYINKPVQRLCKYKQLLEQIIKTSDIKTNNVALDYALLIISKLLRRSNDILHLNAESHKGEIHLELCGSFYLYSAVKVVEDERRETANNAYLFEKSLILIPVQDCIKEQAYPMITTYAVKNLIIGKVDKVKLCVTLLVGEVNYEGTDKCKQIDVLFADLNDLREWCFALNSVIKGGLVKSEPRKSVKMYSTAV